MIMMQEGMFMNEITKYRNKFNEVSMRKWSKEEMNFFFAILAKAKNHGTEALTFDANDLKKLCEYKGKNDQRWKKTMVDATNKLVQLIYREDKDGVYKVMALFQGFEVDTNKGTVEVQLSEKYQYILNEFEKQFAFTSFPLEEFIKIKSTYSKTLYRLLKQYRTTGVYVVKIEDFRFLLDIPKSYRLCDIDQRIIKPSLKDLKPFFRGLKVIKNYQISSKGKRVSAYEFHFQGEKTNEWIEGKPQANPNRKRKAKIEMSVPQYIQDQQAGKITKGDRAETEQIEQLRLQLEKMKQDSPEYPSGYLKEKEGH